MCGNRRCGFSKVPLLDWGGDLANHIKDQVPRLRMPLGDKKCIGSFFIALVNQDRQTHSNNVAVPLSPLHTRTLVQC